MYKQHLSRESTESDTLSSDPRDPRGFKDGGGWDDDEYYDEEDVDNYKPEYFKELPGFEPWYLVTFTAFYRIVQALTATISLGLVTWVNALFTPTYIVQTTLLSAVICSTLLLILYTSNLVRSSKIQWVFHELIYTGLGTYMVGLSLLIMTYSAVRYRYTPWILSVLFLIFCFFAFLADFVSLLSYHRKNPEIRHSDGKRLREDLSMEDSQTF